MRLVSTWKPACLDDVGRVRAEAVAPGLVGGRAHRERRLDRLHQPQDLLPLQRRRQVAGIRQRLGGTRHEGRERRRHPGVELGADVAGAGRHVVAQDRDGGGIGGERVGDQVGRPHAVLREQLVQPALRADRGRAVVLGRERLVPGEFLLGVDDGAEHRAVELGRDRLGAGEGGRRPGRDRGPPPLVADPTWAAVTAGRPARQARDGANNPGNPSVTIRAYRAARAPGRRAARAVAQRRLLSGVAGRVQGGDDGRRAREQPASSATRWPTSPACANSASTKAVGVATTGRAQVTASISAPLAARS